LFLLFLSFWSALELAKIFHRIVFKMAGFDLELLNLSSFNPYQIAENYVLLMILGLAAVVAILPICIALRKPVGKVLG
jgi:hypothetical protein